MMKINQKTKLKKSSFKNQKNYHNLYIKIIKMKI